MGKEAGWVAKRARTLQPGVDTFQSASTSEYATGCAGVLAVSYIMLGFIHH